MDQFSTAFRDIGVASDDDLEKRVGGFRRGQVTVAAGG